MLYYPSDAPCTILFCKLCAVVTSWLTTNACTGGCPPNACANWFVPLVPNISNDGVCGVVVVGAVILGVDTDCSEAVDTGFLVALICFIVLNPWTNAAPYAAAPKAGPIIGMPDKDL